MEDNIWVLRRVHVRAIANEKHVMAPVIGLHAQGVAETSGVALAALAATLDAHKAIAQPQAPQGDLRVQRTGQGQDCMLETRPAQGVEGLPDPRPYFDRDGRGTLA